MNRSIGYLVRRILKGAAFSCLHPGITVRNKASILFFCAYVPLNLCGNL